MNNMRLRSGEIIYKAAEDMIPDLSEELDEGKGKWC